VSFSVIATYVMLMRPINWSSPSTWLSKFRSKYC